jgi:branched-chain amino acid transport system ATP-binding protein
VTSLLEVEGVAAAYGRVGVLHGCTLAVPEGGRVGLFGPNGHGKTTLLRTISGLLRPLRGSIRFAGEGIGGLDPRAIVGRGLLHVAQASRLFPELTVRENLALAGLGRPGGDRHATLARIEALFPRLAERRGQLSRTLSGGERQMLAIGVGLMGRPRLLMLDEPTLGLSPKLKDELCVAIQAIAAQGVTLLVVEQDVEFLAAVTDRLVMLEHGVTTREVTAEGALDRDRIMDLYFGRH